jgi:general secretion pathway protein G
MIVSVNRRLAPRNRAAFTLLEVLVVVAILVILAAVAGVYVFGYLEDAKVDTAKQTIGQLESACKSYITKNGGNPPQDLIELVAPTDGRQPLVDGGQNALIDPWGKPYQYDPTNMDQYNNPDPVVMTTNPQGVAIYSAKRSMTGR